MGSPDEDPEATPVHEVVFAKSFEISTTEVTQGQWEAVMGTNPSAVKGVNLPVTNVSWEDCREFCEKLTTADREKGELSPTTSYRLPTEAEWEYACRAGSTTRYCFGDPTIEPASEGNAGSGEEVEEAVEAVEGTPPADGEDGAVKEDDEEAPVDPKLDAELDRFAWFTFNADGKPHPAAEKEANGWGLFDMHGNVWEWCLDTFDPDFYAESAELDPQCAAGTSRVIRGGSYASAAPRLRSDHRYDSAPHFRYHYVGFRLARATSE